MAKWTCGLLKENAKKTLKNHYWTAFGLCLLASLLGSSSGAGTFDTSLLLDSINTDSDSIIGLIIQLFTFMFLSLLLQALAMAVFLIYYAFLAGPLEVGKCKYFINARHGNADFMTLFSSFSNKGYQSTVKVMFFRELYITLWSLLFVVPGIIKGLEYVLVPYLLAENPHFSKERAFEISKRTMMGEKMDFFVLELSFIGWRLLSLLTCGIGLFFLIPYENATFAEFYACMRVKMLALRITTEEELRGGCCPAPAALASGPAAAPEAQTSAAPDAPTES